MKTECSNKYIDEHACVLSVREMHAGLDSW
jgi:hypothetical protein